MLCNFIALFIGFQNQPDCLLHPVIRQIRDKRNTGVLIEMRRSELLTDLCRLVNEGAIGYDDLDGFSEELREDVIRITSYNAHESE